MTPLVGLLLPAGCGGTLFLESLLIYIVIIVAVVAIIRIMLPWLGSFLGSPWDRVLQIVLWVIVAIIAIRFVFVLLSCV
jgi:hypothetical protein